MFSIGNHEESMAWAFVKSLENKFQLTDNIDFDTEIKERKAILLGKNFLGTTHEDKNRRNLDSNFSMELLELQSKATTIEVYTDHLHRKRTTRTPAEITLDEQGHIVRELGTGNITDEWHDRQGHTMAHKEFEIFEYDEYGKTNIYNVKPYVDKISLAN